jgi:hypothetical protein
MANKKSPAGTKRRGAVMNYLELTIASSSKPQLYPNSMSPSTEMRTSLKFRCKNCILLRGEWLLRGRSRHHQITS